MKIKYEQYNNVKSFKIAVEENRLTLDLVENEAEVRIAVNRYLRDHGEDEILVVSYGNSLRILNLYSYDFFEIKFFEQKDE